ncbi:MAG: cyclic 2,3-diphosphoglycerate synthase [Acidobacteriota bacterium]|jgi:predicted GTPase|nr:cyclic 2,3-diphosphoglycerate synthase [Acidobacteriota bacterium]
MPRIRVVIMGAAGRDFHNFNTVYRGSRRHEVVAFTATQIPNIDGRKYPARLAGALYPKGIPIVSEQELPRLIVRHKIQEVAFSYSDVSNQYVMERAALVNACGADFVLLGAGATMLAARVPVIAVVAVRTGSGKSQTSRKVCSYLRSQGLRVVAVRHPMPYGNLIRQMVQRYATLEDLKKHRCTVEEMEEYEPHIVEGGVIYAGVDYAAILRQAEREADVIVWDGGNNDLSFYRPDLTITVVDPHRPGHERTYYPGAANVQLADVLIINKVDSASEANVAAVLDAVAHINPKAQIIRAASPITVDNPDIIKGKSVLVVEDGPTLTHGGMQFGAGTLAARLFGAREIVDPRPYAVRSIAEAFRKYPETGILLPAMGYGPDQIGDLEATLNKVPCEAVVIGTPIDLRRIVKIEKPSTRVQYSLEELSKPDLQDVLDGFVRKHIKGRAKASSGSKRAVLRN